MQAILLNPDYDFSQAYYLITGVAGTPPSRGTIGDVVWGSWLIDYDLGHRWAPEEGEPGAPVFMPRKGYEEYRVHQLNPELVAWGVHLSSDVKLKDSKEAQTYRMRYPDEAAQAAPSVKVVSEPRRCGHQNILAGRCGDDGADTTAEAAPRQRCTV